MNLLSSNELKVHIVLLSPGAVASKEELEDRRLLLQVDTLSLDQDILSVEVSDKERLKGLVRFRPGVLGGVQVTENGHKRMKYFAFHGMQVCKNVWGKPTVIKFKVQDLQLERKI